MDNKTACKWLCYCLKTENSEQDTSKLKTLSVSDWNDIVQQSLQHEVTPLLYRNLKNFRQDIGIPDEIVQKMRETYLYFAERNMRLYGELSKVLKVLHSDGTEIIALKGVYLAEIIYGNIVLRPMGDIDLLVRKDDLVKLGKKLVQAGYTSSIPFWDEAKGAVFSHKHLPHFTKTGTAKTDWTKIDLHWHIMEPEDPFRIDIDALWERAEPVTIAGTEILVLSPEDLILHLCFHVSYGHRFKQGFKPLCDISRALLYYRDKIDWDQVRVRTRKWGIGKGVYLALYLTRELLAADVPDEILNSLEPEDFTVELIIRAEEAIFKEQITDYDDYLVFNFKQIWKVKQLLKSISGLVKKAFPAPEVLALFYSVSSSSKWIYFYYPVRLKDLFVKFCRVSWRLLFADRKGDATADNRNNKNTLSNWLSSV